MVSVEEMQFDELQEKVYEFKDSTQSMGVTLGDEASHKTLPAEAANQVTPAARMSDAYVDDEVLNQTVTKEDEGIEENIA